MFKNLDNIKEKYGATVHEFIMYDGDDKPTMISYDIEFTRWTFLDRVKATVRADYYMLKIETGLNFTDISTEIVLPSNLTMIPTKLDAVRGKLSKCLFYDGVFINLESEKKAKEEDTIQLISDLDDLRTEIKKYFEDLRNKA